MEFFSWRTFRNSKQVGSLAGLTPTPKDSGKRYREQGIGKDGSRHIRGSAIELAWGWLRFQPENDHLVRAARYSAWCRFRHRPLDGAARPEALQSPMANKGSCVRRIAVGTDGRWFGRDRTYRKAARKIIKDLSRGESDV